jgi:hypothetical protein
MKCAELLTAFNEYVEGTVDPGICEEFEALMSECNPCRVVLDNIRKTITVYREGRPHALPVECHQRLHAALRRRWKETHSTGAEAAAS